MIQAERRIQPANPNRRRFLIKAAALIAAGAATLAVENLRAPLNLNRQSAHPSSTPTPEVNEKPKSTKDRISLEIRTAFAGNRIMERYFNEFIGTSLHYIQCKTSEEFNGKVSEIAAIGPKEGYFTHSKPSESPHTRIGTINASEVKTVRELVIEDNWGSKVVYGVLGDEKNPEFILLRSQSGKITTDHIAQRGLDKCLEDAGMTELVAK